ncbi:MAG: tautomerase family protein [Actinomycetota bacterium]|nr:tautomerase family protein [Actinomycetota bacterium]
MPLVQLEFVKGRLPCGKKLVFDAIHEALVEALKIPDSHRHQRLIEHEAEDFDTPSPNYTMVTITMYPGRSLAAKRNLYRGIVDKLGELGIAGSDINIVVIEPPLDNWGSGGIPASERDLGVDLNV